MPEELIQDVSDTAFMIAAYREMEANRTNPLFCDPLAATGFWETTSLTA